MATAAVLRFAPSPTGPLHLGGLRTALMNHIMARKLGGKWILRVEDTDQARLVSGSVENITRSLEWARLDYDFGPGKGGPHAPYFQSARLDLYKVYADKLLDNGSAYRCFCPADRLKTVRDDFLKLGLNQTYDRRCRHITDEEARRKVKAGEKYVVRLHQTKQSANLPLPTDIIFGPLRDTRLSVPTDPILVKSDLFPTYHFASVVDDHEMGITHVLRGEEWLLSMPIHLDLYAALGIQPPQFGHLPLLLNPDGSKMSKRKGDVRVADYIEKGWEPDTVLNWLALAGWGRDNLAKTPEVETDVLPLPQLINQLDLADLTHRKTILDPGKLAFLNKKHMRLRASTPAGLDDLARRAEIVVKEAFPGSEFASTSYLARIIPVLSDRVTLLSEIPNLAPYFFVDPDYSTAEASAMQHSVPAETYDNAVASLRSCLTSVDPSEWNPGELQAAIGEVKNTLDVKPKFLMKSLRHALTGVESGPTLIEIMDILGKERTISRLQRP